jgi:hypothetical protein
MHYDLVSRALAFVSCLTAVSLFATSMAIAAINVGKGPPSLACSNARCTAAPVTVGSARFGEPTKMAPLPAVADWLSSRKI